jgi:hypothetical protein
VAPVAWPSPFWKMKVEGRSVVARYVSLSKLTPDDFMETRVRPGGPSLGTRSVISTSPSENRWWSDEKNEAAALFTTSLVASSLFGIAMVTFLRSTRSESLTCRKSSASTSAITVLVFRSVSVKCQCWAEEFKSVGSTAGWGGA